MRRFFLLTTYCLILTTALSGCAGGRYLSSSKLGPAVSIGGRRFVSVRTLAENYNLEYEWDAVARKAILTKDGSQARMMAESSTVLLNDTICAMEQEARFYQSSLVIPQSFAHKRLLPFFRKSYGKKEVPLPRAPSFTVRRVVIDPGHGGKDPGAIGKGGLKEKDVVLDIAQKLKRKLEKAGIDVVMTRDSDRSVSLEQRAKIANTQRADLFISIHANASRSRWVSGVEVFYLCESVDDNARCLKAAKDYDLNLKEDYSGKDTEEIIWFLELRENRKSSIELAEFISRSLSKDLKQRNRGEKPARFYVLKANIPAVLVEVGFISNSREEKKLRDSSYKDKIARALSEGLKQYNRQFSGIRSARR